MELRPEARPVGWRQRLVILFNRLLLGPLPLAVLAAWRVFPDAAVQGSLQSYNGFSIGCESLTNSLPFSPRFCMVSQEL